MNNILYKSIDKKIIRLFLIEIILLFFILFFPLRFIPNNSISFVLFFSAIGILLFCYKFIKKDEKTLCFLFFYIACVFFVKFFIKEKNIAQLSFYFFVYSIYILINNYKNRYVMINIEKNVKQRILTSQIYSEYLDELNSTIKKTSRFIFNSLYMNMFRISIILAMFLCSIFICYGMQYIFLSTLFLSCILIFVSKKITKQNTKNLKLDFMLDFGLAMNAGFLESLQKHVSYIQKNQIQIPENAIFFEILRMSQLIVILFVLCMISINLGLVRNILLTKSLVPLLLMSFSYSVLEIVPDLPKNSSEKNIYSVTVPPEYLKMHNCSIYIDNKILIDDINLTLEKGNIYKLTGSSGCGKTSLIKSLIGLVEITSGSLNIGGEIIKSTSRLDVISVIDNKVQYCAQNNTPNVSTIGQYLDNKNKNLIDFLLKELNLEKFLSNYDQTSLASLSQRQKSILLVIKSLLKLCYIPRKLNKNISVDNIEITGILIVDETFDRMDTKDVMKIYRILKKSLKKGKLMLVFSSHKDIFPFDKEIIIQNKRVCVS